MAKRRLWNSSKPDRDELQQSLARLHAELMAAPRVDESSRRLLREVLADIERLLKQTPSATTGAAAVPPAPAASAESLPGSARQSAAPMEAAPRRLESLAVQFEADHPALAASLRQFIDLLGRAGL